MNSGIKGNFHDHHKYVIKLNNKPFCVIPNNNDNDVNNINFLNYL